MATVLTLALGFLIGWALKARFASREIAEATVDRFAAQWADHVKAHAETQAASLVITAPPLLDVLEHRAGGSV